MGKSGGGDGTVRFAPYMEITHMQLIARAFTYMSAVVDDSPYEDAVTVDPKDGFLGVGYTVDQFPALFDMFGKFMAGLDIEVLWTQIYTESVQGSEVADAISSAGAMLQDEIDVRVMPKFLGGMRDINAVQSSAFITGKALIADSKVKTLGEITSKLQMHMVDVADGRWAKHLNWNMAVIQEYRELQKIYYSAEFDSQSRVMEYRVKDKQWNLSLLEYGRSIVGALNGAASAHDVQVSQAAKSIAGIAAGSAVGAEMGSSFGEHGSAYGGLAGGILGYAASMLG